ncbi:hypothetical protein LINPERHAP1_LOCUS32505, partial [Linum perenne]
CFLSFFFFIIISFFVFVLHLSHLVFLEQDVDDFSKLKRPNSMALSNWLF